MCANVSCLVRGVASMMSQCAKCSAPRMPRISHRIRGGRVACDASYSTVALHRPPPARIGGRNGYNPATATASPFYAGRDDGSARSYTQAASTLTREQLHDLVYRLNEDERELLMNTLKQFESNKVKAKFEGEI